MKVFLKTLPEKLIHLKNSSFQKSLLIKTSNALYSLPNLNTMGEYIGFFIFLFFLLMAFWILIFLVGFLGYWATMGGLNAIMPGLFKKKEEEIEESLNH